MRQSLNSRPLRLCSTVTATFIKTSLLLLLASQGLQAQTLQYANALMGDENQSITALSVGKDKKLYVGGFFEKTCDFDPGSGTTTITAGVETDAYFAKFDTAGSLIWVKHLENSLAIYNDVNNGAINLVADNNGNVVLVGSSTPDIDMDPGPAVVNVPWGGYYDTYIAKYNPIGDLIWAHSFAGPYWDVVNGLQLDPWDNILVSGSFYDSLDFDLGPGINMHYAVGYDDCFLAKYTPGGDLVWVRTWGSPYSDLAGTFHITTDNHIYLACISNDSLDLDPEAGIHMAAGGTHLTEFDPSGHFLRAMSFGGGWAGTDVKVSPDHHIYLAGGFNGTVDFDPGPGTLLRTNTSAFSDIYLACYDSAFTPIWVNTMGSNGLENAGGIQLNASGDLIAHGKFPYTVDFDPSPDTASLTVTGMVDGWMARYDGATGSLEWLMQLGGTGIDYFHSMTLGPDGSIFASGALNSTVDFDPQAPVFDIATIDKYDGWFAKYTDEVITATQPAAAAGEGLTLFPNPTTGHLTLTSETALGICTILDATGRVILTQDLHQAHRATLGLHNLPAGLYLLQTTQGTQRFIKH